MNEWTPPQSVEYRAPAEGLGVLRKMLEGLSRRISALEGTAPLKQAGVRGRPGLLSSLDYDGDGTHADLGTQGWMLGGDPAFLALHGVDVIADLAAKDVTLAAQDTVLGGLIADLTAQQAILTELVSKVIEVDDFAHTETGFDPVAGAWATVSSVTLTVPAGFTQAVVTASAYAGITSAGGDIHCRALVAGAGGPADTRSTSPSQWRPVLSMFSHRVAGLTGGGTFTVASQAYVATDVGADAANTATISGTVLWLR